LRQQAASGPYFLGEQYSLADVAIAPFYARIRATNQFGWGVSDLEAVKSNSRLAEFLNGITDRPSFKDTYIGDETLTEMMKERFGA
jgi:glutathione S-transferase